MKNRSIMIFFIVLFWSRETYPSNYDYPGFWGTFIPGAIGVGIVAIGLVGYGFYDDYCLRQAPLENQIKDATECLAKPAWQDKEMQDKLQRKIARLKQAMRERDEKKKREQEKTEQQQEEKIMNGSEETTPQSQFPLGKDFKSHEKQESQGGSSHFLAPTANGIPLGQNQSYSQFYAPIFPQGLSSRLSEPLQAMTKLWSEMKGSMRTVPSYNQQEGQYNGGNDDNPFIN